ncbi:hypothetical protein P167DRAFT_547686 [Morchella conica CCBAS932]|uniref:Uncharacterized protein n=1 Tax=Morchella conica CCBAS932 TaxID=1392247 RepID=A0A3N4KNK0_9PEZI|nr:hypothetical protein P167DRAFT_547686 [Morchella conica CCBAS932]
MSLSLFHQHAKTKRHWAQQNPDKLLEILNKTEWVSYPAVDWMTRFSEIMSSDNQSTEGKTRKVIGRRALNRIGAMTKKQKEDSMLAAWDLRSACCEWGAIKLKELSGRRNFEADTHLDLSKTITAFMKRLPKGPELDTMKSWEEDYKAAYESALYNEGTSTIWAFLVDSREYGLPRSWLEEFHQFCLRWPWELEVSDAVGELRNAIQAALLEAKAIAKKPLVHNFDSLRFSILCMSLDQFDAIFQLKLYMQDSLDSAGVFEKFTEKDVETFADFEVSIRQIDFGGVMPAIGRWIRYARIAIDLDRYCTGYAWDFITFCAHMTTADNFVWIWDVNENFDQHRLDRKISLAKSFMFELKRLINQRFPTGYDSHHANQGSTKGATTTDIGKDDDSDGWQHELNMLKRKPFFVEGDLLKTVSSKAGMGKDIKTTFKLFGQIFKGWVDDMSQVLCVYEDKSSKVFSKAIFDGKLGPFEIKVHKPLHFVLLRFAAFLYEEDVELPLGLKDRLRDMTVKYTNKITETSESVSDYLKKEDADILVIPQKIKIPPVRVTWFKTLSDLISRAVELESESDDLVAAHTEAPTEPATLKTKTENPKSDISTTAHTETTQPEKHSRSAKSECDKSITDQVDKSEKDQSHQDGESKGSNISRGSHELHVDQLETPEIRPIIDHTDHVLSDHTSLDECNLSVLVLNQSYINNPTGCNVPTGVATDRDPPPNVSTGPNAAIPPANVGNAIQSIVDYSRNTSGDIHALHEEIYSLRALVTLLIDGDARSRRILMERGHSAVPFAQMRTDPTLDRSSIFSQTGSQYAATLIAPPAPDGTLGITDAEFYS